MLVNTNEARQKGCPIMTRPMAHKDYLELETISVFPVECVGSACMAWQWYDNAVCGEYQEETGQMEYQIIDPSIRRGFCGFVGALEVEK